MRRKPQGWFSLSHDDPDMEGVETTITTSDGEMVDLHPWVAMQRHNARVDQMNRRIAYCRDNNIDIERYTGCPDCEGTGFGFRGLACHCGQGRTRLILAERQEEAITDNLRRHLMDPTWITDPIRDRHRGKTGEA
jgi:hypothetical protein